MSKNLVDKLDELEDEIPVQKIVKSKGKSSKPKKVKEDKRKDWVNPDRIDWDTKAEEDW